MDYSIGDVERYALNPTGRKTDIVQAELEQNAGVIGAAALWYNIIRFTDIVYVF